MSPTYTLLKELLKSEDSGFWGQLSCASRNAVHFEDIIALSTLRKRALMRMVPADGTLKPLRLAIIGGYSLYPLRELVEQSLYGMGYAAELWVGEYDNYISEMLDETSGLYSFKPEVVLIIPAERRMRYNGTLVDPRDQIAKQSAKDCEQLLGFIDKLNQKTQAEIILCNLIPDAGHDLGSYRNKTLASPWNYTAQLNLELGLNAPAYVHICDANFLASRRGLLSSRDRRGWFESKQLGSPALLVDLARETAYIISSFKQAMKKVLVLDLDNTLWGGVIGDDGLDGIELGDTSPRGEAFKAFQKYILSLTERGILIAVCSKNDYDKAIEPFEKHREMVIRKTDVVSFKANWQPKSENIRAIAKELNLGLDSFVFVDDNPAEIEIVRQFLPQVSTIQLSEDPSEYLSQLEDARFFEPLSITKEDRERSSLYVQQTRYKEMESSATDMESYLASLDMKATISEFVKEDVPRISQLIKKSNQFNLTTKRRTESEVTAIMQSPQHVSYTIRLADKFGDHGLIAIVVGLIEGQTIIIDTWLMSCRVLKRQVEEETLNELVRLAALKNCSKIIGVYIPSPKNDMTKELYPSLGFSRLAANDEQCEYFLDVNCYTPKSTRIDVIRRAYDSVTSDRKIAGHL